MCFGDEEFDVYCGCCNDVVVGCGFDYCVVFFVVVGNVVFVVFCGVFDYFVC